MTRQRLYQVERGDLLVRVPSVTEILSATQSTDWLINWAVKLAQRGDSHEAVRDRAARVGTIAHEMIAAGLEDRAPQAFEEIADEREMRDADAAAARWTELSATRIIEPVLIEAPLVSDVHEFGGTPDLLARVDGVPTVIDFKTGRHPGGKGLLQLGAYALLLRENGSEVERGMIACIGSRDTGLYSFGNAILTDAGRWFLGLKAAVDIWREADALADEMRRPTAGDWLELADEMRRPTAGDAAEPDHTGSPESPYAISPFATRAPNPETYGLLLLGSF